MIKFNTWEKIMADQMSVIRKKERGFLIKLFFIKGLLRGITNFMPLLAGLGCFWVYNSQHDTPLSTARTYGLIALFNGFVDPIQYGLNIFDIVIKSYVANNRVKKLLMIDTTK